MNRATRRLFWACLVLAPWSAGSLAAEGPDPEFAKPAPSSMAEMVKRTTARVSTVEVNDYAAGHYTGAMTPRSLPCRWLYLCRTTRMNGCMPPCCEALEFNQPLIVQTAASHPGSLPKRWGFLSVSHPGFVVSALKMSEDGKAAILRIYKAAGKPANGVKITVSAPVASAWEVNLMEDSVGPFPVADDALQFDLRPFEIKTFKLELRDGLSRR